MYFRINDYYIFDNNTNSRIFLWFSIYCECRVDLEYSTDLMNWTKFVVILYVCPLCLHRF